ncbi:MAG: phosphoribosyltransferase [Chloroflexota bacterium]
MLFKDRLDAGRQLAQALARYRGVDAWVLALPRGGVVVGYEVAVALALPLDVIITRKIGAPGNPEYAIGAVCETGEVELNRGEIAYFGISRAFLAEQVAEERREIARRSRLYRGDTEPPDVRDRRVIVVDDGIATGYTILATVRALRSQSPAELVVAVPVAPPVTVAQMESEADRVVCLATPESFMAVGAWYEDFAQVPDDEVRRLLVAARERARA